MDVAITAGDKVYKTFENSQDGKRDSAGIVILTPVTDESKITNQSQYY